MVGCSLTDAIWNEVATLRSLRRLELEVLLMSFTVNGILDFIEKLGPGNKDLVLSVKDGNKNSEFSRAEQDLIQEMIAKKVQGSYTYEQFEWK